MSRRMETRVMMMTSEKAFIKTRPIASLQERSAAKDAIETTVIYGTSSSAEMHAAELKPTPKLGA
jgi:hypothetical protein